MEKQRRIRRTGIAIEKAIFDAVKELVEEVGYSNITVTAVIARAKIEPIVFYKRYKNIDHLLDSLLDKLVFKYDYWFGPAADPVKFTDRQKFYLKLLKNLADSLYKNKSMQKLLLWELEEDNPATRRIAGMREAYWEGLMDVCDRYFREAGVEDIRGTTAILIGGIYYLMLHKERSTFCGIDMNTKEGKEKLLDAIDFVTQCIFEARKLKQTREEIARKMKQKGIDIDTIVECTSLDKGQLEKL